MFVKLFLCAKVDASPRRLLFVGHKSKTAECTFAHSAVGNIRFSESYFFKNFTVLPSAFLMI